MLVAVIKEAADSILPMIAHGPAMPTRSHVDPQRHGASGQKLPRRALCQDALQGTAVPVPPPCPFTDVAGAHLIDSLAVLPTHAICRPWVVRPFALLGARCPP